jgi:hypothetical protein
MGSRLFSGLGGLAVVTGLAMVACGGGATTSGPQPGRMLAGSSPSGEMSLNADGTFQYVTFTNCVEPRGTVMTANGKALIQDQLGGGDAAHRLADDPGPVDVLFVESGGGERISCTMLTVGGRHGFSLVSSPDGTFHTGDHLVLEWSPPTDTLQFMGTQVYFVQTMADGSTLTDPLPSRVNGNSVEADVPDGAIFLEPQLQIPGTLEIDAVFLALGQKPGDCSDASWAVRMDYQTTFRVPATHVRQ